jgi:hypothetical protein
VPAARWLASHTNWRRATIALVAVNCLVSLVLGLPLVPQSTVGKTPIAGINQVVQDSIGWPRYVRQVARAYQTVPAAQRAHTIIYASNYGEAGAVDRYGPAYGLPAVYSGQNQLAYERRPPNDATTAVVVGGQYADVRRLFGDCHVVAHLDNNVGVDNEEQGEPVAICNSPKASWPALWPKLHHLD